jgi:hypothetical protein
MKPDTPFISVQLPLVDLILNKLTINELRLWHIFYAERTW